MKLHGGLLRLDGFAHEGVRLLVRVQSLGKHPEVGYRVLEYVLQVGVLARVLAQVFVTGFFATSRAQVARTC